jgi:hypothetical protein
MTHNANPGSSQRRHNQPKTPLRNTTMLQRFLTFLLRRPVAFVTTIAILATTVAAVQSNAQTAPINQVKPVVECREARPEGQFVWFGYQNDWNAPITITVSSTHNKFTPTPIDRGQPTTFAVGRQRKIFAVQITTGNQVWTLKSPNGTTRTATASSNTTLCPAATTSTSTSTTTSTTVEPTTTSTTLLSGTSTSTTIASDTDADPGGNIAEEIRGALSAPDMVDTLTVTSSEPSQTFSVEVKTKTPVPASSLNVGIVEGPQYFRTAALTRSSASEIIEIDFANPDAISNAVVRIGLDEGRLDPVDPWGITLAYFDEPSGFWIPVESTVDPITKSVTAQVTHFSNWVAMKDRPKGGSWSAPFLDGFFGPFPPPCGTGSKTTDLVLMMDMSGSIGTDQVDQHFVDFAAAVTGILRSGDRFGVLSLDGFVVKPFAPARRGAGVEAVRSEAPGGFGDSDSTPALRTARSWLETASPSNNTQRRLVILKDDGARVPEAQLEPLKANGVSIDMFVYRPNSGVLPVSAASTFNLGLYTPARLAGQLRRALDLRSDSGSIDRDLDGLPDCEEENGLFFPTPNFPPNANEEALIGYQTVHLSYTSSATNDANNDGKIDGLDTDKDGTNDGDEIVRRSFADSPLLAVTFQNIGVNNYYVADTGLPDRIDTDFDRLNDPPTGERLEYCPSKPKDVYFSSPLLVDTDGDGEPDKFECDNGTVPQKSFLTGQSWKPSAEPGANGIIKATLPLAGGALPLSSPAPKSTPGPQLRLVVNNTATGPAQLPELAPTPVNGLFRPVAVPVAGGLAVSAANIYVAWEISNISGQSIDEWLVPHAQAEPKPAIKKRINGVGCEDIRMVGDLSDRIVAGATTQIMRHTRTQVAQPGNLNPTALELAVDGGVNNDQKSTYVTGSGALVCWTDFEGDRKVANLMIFFAMSGGPDAWNWNNPFLVYDSPGKSDFVGRGAPNHAEANILGAITRLNFVRQDNKGWIRMFTANRNANICGNCGGDTEQSTLKSFTLKYPGFVLSNVTMTAARSGTKIGVGPPYSQAWVGQSGQYCWLKGNGGNSVSSGLPLSQCAQYVPKVP